MVNLMNDFGLYVIAELENASSTPLEDDLKTGEIRKI